MDCLHFSRNWNNKLFCDSFTTIRLADKERFIIGKLFRCDLMDENNEVVFSKVAKLVSIWEFPISKLSEGMAQIDCAKTAEKARGMFYRMYKNKVTDFDSALFVHLILAKP